MIPICPVQLWILSALDYFKYNIHENWDKKLISMKVGLSDQARQMLSNGTHMSCPIMDFKCSRLL